VLGLWTLVWMLGALAGRRTHPHLISESGLRVRKGAFVDIRLPWSAIASVTTKEVALPTALKSLQPLETASGTDLRVAVSGRVNIQAQLRAPIVVPTRKGKFTVSQVSFWVDDPPPGGHPDPRPGGGPASAPEHLQVPGRRRPAPGTRPPAPRRSASSLVAEA